MQLGVSETYSVFLRALPDLTLLEVLVVPASRKAMRGCVPPYRLFIMAVGLSVCVCVCVCMCVCVCVCLSVGV